MILHFDILNWQWLRTQYNSFLLLFKVIRENVEYFGSSVIYVYLQGVFVIKLFECWSPSVIHNKQVLWSMGTKQRSCDSQVPLELTLRIATALCWRSRVMHPTSLVCRRSAMIDWRTDRTRGLHSKWRWRCVKWLWQWLGWLYYSVKLQEGRGAWDTLYHRHLALKYFFL